MKISDNPHPLWESDSYHLTFRLGDCSAILFSRFMASRTTAPYNFAVWDVRCRTGQWLSNVPRYNTHIWYLYPLLCMSDRTVCTRPAGSFLCNNDINSCIYDTFRNLIHLALSDGRQRIDPLRPKPWCWQSPTWDPWSLCGWRGVHRTQYRRIVFRLRVAKTEKEMVFEEDHQSSPHQAVEVPTFRPNAGSLPIHQYGGSVTTGRTVI